MNNLRALLIGGGAPDALRVAGRVGPGATIVCFAPDRPAAAAIRHALNGAAPTAHVAVMVGDPALLVHKVSGPFDLILDAHGASSGNRVRLLALLRENGELDG